MLKRISLLATVLACTWSLNAQALSFTKMGKDLTEQERAELKAMLPHHPTPKDDELVHIPPTMEDLEASQMHPKLKEAIRRGHDLFVNTQQLRGKNIFNNMNCTSCHMGDGRRPFAGPVWAAAVTLPDFRGKNGHVNSLEERIVGCFTYSMNGISPPYGSDDMLALVAYHQWLAKGVPMYPEAKLYGRGYPKPKEADQKPDFERGKQAYMQNCAACHGEDGQGVMIDGKVQFPALWGDHSFNWGAGMVRVPTLAGFIKNNMPLGKTPGLSDQEAWDIAQFVNSQERPQDPRYTGDVKETRAKYEATFHKQSMYGKELNGKLLGDHANTGDKPILKPDILRPRDFSGKSQ